MTDNDDQGDREPRKMIYEIRRRVQQARNHYWAEGVEGEISDQTHRQLAVAVLQYHDVLYEFRSEAVLSEGDFPDVSPVRDRIGRRVPKRVEQSGLGRPSTVDRVPAVTDVPVEKLVDLSEDLDDLAKKLGFGAQAAEKTPVFGVDPEWDPDEEEENASSAD